MKITHLLGALLLAISATSQAGVIVGKSALLDDNGLAQLETWLGRGELTLMNVFTKFDGSNSTDFHAAVDDRGSTFTVMTASMDGVTWKTIGGYNPHRWWSATFAPNGRSIQIEFEAFIFNLTDSVKKMQARTLQTQNLIHWGPVFGANDLVVFGDLSVGRSALGTYGDIGNINTGPTGPDYQRSMVDGSIYDGRNFLVGALEVFTIATSPPPSTNVPEPGSAALFSLGLLAFAASRRQIKQA